MTTLFPAFWGVKRYFSSSVFRVVPTTWAYFSLIATRWLSIKILNLSDRDAARVLQKMETLENSDVFLIQLLLEEKQELAVQVRQLEAALQPGIASDSEKELFDQSQAEMERCLTQIGRKTEQLRLLEDEILALEKRIQDIEPDVKKLYEKHHVSKEKTDFIEECDAIANLLNQYTVRLRKNKVHLLQEKTFEMYRMLSSKSGLILLLKRNSDKKQCLANARTIETWAQGMPTYFDNELLQFQFPSEVPIKKNHAN